MIDHREPLIDSLLFRGILGLGITLACFSLIFRNNVRELNCEGHLQCSAFQYNDYCHGNYHRFCCPYPPSIPNCQFFQTECWIMQQDMSRKHICDSKETLMSVFFYLSTACLVSLICLACYHKKRKAELEDEDI